MEKKSARKIGEDGENIVAKYLMLKGFEIISRNFYIRGGEVDVVALDRDTLVFVEVKFRTTDTFGTGAEQLNRQKRKRIKVAGICYLQKHGCEHDFNGIRYDFIALTQIGPAKFKLKHFKNIEL